MKKSAILLSLVAIIGLVGCKGNFTVYFTDGTSVQADKEPTHIHEDWMTYDDTCGDAVVVKEDAIESWKEN